MSNSKLAGVTPNKIHNHSIDDFRSRDIPGTPGARFGPDYAP